MTPDELMQLLKEAFDYSMTNVHTSFPGVVKSYDPNTRRADIQPSIKRRLPDGTFMALPMLTDVPVRFPGNKKYTIHFPLEMGDEVEVSVCERATDLWRSKGGMGHEDKDLRRFSLNDCYCTPGLQPQEFIVAEAPGLEIIHKTAWDGDIIDHFLMDDDQVDFIRLEKTKDSYHWHLDKDMVESTFVIDDVQIMKTTIDGYKIETLYKDITAVLINDDKVEIVSSAEQNINFEKKITRHTDDELTETVEKAAKYKSNNTDIESNLPVGIKGGGSNLGSSCLRPYWDQEKMALDLYDAIAVAPIPILLWLARKPEVIAQKLNDTLTKAKSSLIIK
jgi:hypothetical protein